jgi:hypothetical protein
MPEEIIFIKLNFSFYVCPWMTHVGNRMEKSVVFMAEYLSGGIPMSKKNVTNRAMTVVYPVSSNRGKPELETCNRKKRGCTVNFFLIGIILALLPVVSSASDPSVIIVRDRYGNIVETKERYGDDTTVRDRYGNIIRTEEYDGQGQKTIRDRAGNIMGTEDRD